MRDKRSLKRPADVVTIFVTLGFLVALLGAERQEVELVKDHQIQLCHATSSEKNPYVLVQPSKFQIYRNKGHAVHPGDIIPPFAAGSHGGQSWGDFAGQNWDEEGQAIFNNGCNVVKPSPSPTPTEEPTPTPTPTITDEPSPSPSPSPTPTPTITVTPTPTPTLTPTDTPTPPESPSPPPTDGGIPPKNPPPDKPQLPFTGLPVVVWLLIGLGSISLGLAILRRDGDGSEG